MGGDGERDGDGGDGDERARERDGAPHVVVPRARLSASDATRPPHVRRQSVHHERDGDGRENRAARAGRDAIIPRQSGGVVRARERLRRRRRRRIRHRVRVRVRVRVCGGDDKRLDARVVRVRVRLSREDGECRPRGGRVRLASKERSARDMKRRRMDMESHCRSVRSFAKNVLGSTLTGTMRRRCGVLAFAGYGTGTGATVANARAKTPRGYESTSPRDVPGAASTSTRTVARASASASAGPAAPTADSVEDEESTARSRVGSLAMVPAGRIRAASNAARVSSVIQCGTRRTRSAPAAVAVPVKNLENFRTSTTRATETASSIHAGASSCSFTSSTAYGNDARARRVASGSDSNVRPKGAPRASSKRTSTSSDTRTAFVSAR